MSENTPKDKMPGFFGWNELMSSDALAAKDFYAKTFGWESKEEDMGDFTYHFFEKDGEMTAGLMQIDPERTDVKSAWMSYINVADIDETCALAEAAGGKVLQPRMPISDFGAMAIIEDPTGATVALWQTLKEQDC